MPTTDKIFIDARVFRIQPNRGTAKNLKFYIDVLKSLGDDSLEYHVHEGSFQSYKGFLGAIKYVLEEQLLFPLIMAWNCHNWILSPLHTTPILLLKAKRIMLLHDLMFMDNIKLYGVRGSMFASSIYRSVCIWASVGRVANKVITISETTFEDLKRISSRTQQNVTIIPCCLDFDCVPRATVKTQTDQQAYFLCVSGSAEHKNFNIVKTLFTAPGNSRWRLKVVGLDMPSACDHSITYYQGISDDDMGELYANCRGLIFPSLNEGFGIPLLEGMMFDKPIACSDIAIFKEIMGETAFYFDPTDIKSVAQAVKEMSEASLPPQFYRQQKKSFSIKENAPKAAEFFIGL